MQSSLPSDRGERGFLDYGHEQNWAWSSDLREGWKVLTDISQGFYEHWRNISSGSNFHDTFPYELLLGVDPDGVPLLPFHSNKTSGNRILVTKSYDIMLRRILHLRMNDKSSDQGVVLTGQPGIGKTTFQKFMLLWLISARQVVLLCDNNKVYLFYCGQVYFRPTETGFEDLPVRIRASYYPLWTLIDVNYENHGPPINAGSNIWPIQTSSPNPSRWKSWRKQNGAALLGMPLWNTEELMEGLHLRPEYNGFRSKLDQYLPLLDESTPPTADGQSIDAALKVLWIEREREKIGEAEKEDDRNEMGDDIRASTADEMMMADEAGQPQALVDSALKILVDNAIEEFGFAPRDVYNAVFDLFVTRNEHAAAIEPDYSSLGTLVTAFSKSCGLNDSPHRVVVYPCPFADNYDDWLIDFKSIRIAKQAVELMRLQEDEHLRTTYVRFRKIPENSVLAGWIFEAIVHRKLSGGWSDGPLPQPICMESNGCSPPAFFTHHPPLSSSTPDTSLVPLRTGTRAVARIDFARALSNVTPDNNKYYIPTTPSRPFFDSFTIDHDPQQRTTVISVFQITASPRHKGSGKGYPFIRKIMTRVREHFKNFKITVKVVYFLVCPDDGFPHQWQMPIGWNDTVIKNDHRGDVFCILVPMLA